MHSYDLGTSKLTEILQNTMSPLSVLCHKTELNVQKSTKIYSDSDNDTVKVTYVSLLHFTDIKNPSSVSDTDREIPILGSTYNAGNSVSDAD